MFRTALILIFTIIVVPFMAFKFGAPLTSLQLEVLTTLMYTCLGISLACFIVSELSKNYSQTDKLWSVTPIIYAWIACAYDDWSLRMVFLSVLVTIWGLRLSYNFNRRGGYSLKFWEGEEDYRWAILQQSKPFNIKWVFSLFNLFFISLYQHFLILFFTLPIILSINKDGLSWVDYLLGFLLILLVFIEWKADEEQWNYQTAKHQLLKEGKTLKGIFTKGFTHTGLWSISRHPNYAAEQSIWFVFYLFSVVATGQIINWSIIGVLLLIILFKSSSDFSESISEKKYPDYKDYQKNVGRFIPKLLK